MTVKLLTDSGAVSAGFEDGQTLLDVIRGRSLPVHAPCGGAGTCKKCTVYIVDGGGERAVLACRTPAQDGMTVRLPGAAELVVQLHGEGEAIEPDPGLSGYGIACDIGTTTVVCHLMDLGTGRTLATAGEGNAQRPYGGDVIARIKASIDGRLFALTAAIRSQLGNMISSLCAGAGIDARDVRFMTVAGNTTMCHILTGLSPDGMGAAPFTPLSRFGESVAGSSLGLPVNGPVYIAPAVSGYVGGDITADLLAVDADRDGESVLLIDVGTNGEMALGCGEKLISCATAAGPAFEGAQIRFGMAAAEGAIGAVELDGGEIKCTVIGGGEAVGICGSGLIDAVAVMLELGAVDETGRLLDIDEDDDIPPAAEPYLFLLDDEPAFRLSGDVAVTQADVRKLQLGKGAIAAGIQVLCKAGEKEMGRPARLLLAGGFGSYIRPESAARIGMIPYSLLSVTSAVGNAAARGMQQALVSAQARQRLARLQSNTRYVELSGLPDFNSAYIEAMMFPEEAEV